ncbi:unnamed protein product [Symbiodinium sp. CCMP2592]|nr:unnamed protein product [Symbiodinium sp. CCMP2592]
MTAGRRLSDQVSEDRSKAAYDSTRQARAVACALLGGFSVPSEARALKSFWALQINRSSTATTPSLLKDIEALIGSLMVSSADEGGKLEIAKMSRHVAISSFTKTFSTRAFLAVYDIDLASTNVPETFIAPYDKLIGLQT